MIAACLVHLNDKDPYLRQWSCICIGRVWHGFEEAKTSSFRDSRICGSLVRLANLDAVPEVRVAALSTLGTLLAPFHFEIETPPPVDFGEGVGSLSEFCLSSQLNVCVGIFICAWDASILVRKELIVALSNFVNANISKIIHATVTLFQADSPKPNLQTVNHSASLTTRFPAHLSIDDDVYLCVWRTILNLSGDPQPEVAALASSVVDHVNRIMIFSICSCEDVGLSPSSPLIPSPLPSIQLPAPQKLSARLKILEHFESRNLRKPIAATAAILPSPFPLDSDFFNWSATLFMEPRLKVDDNNLPGGKGYDIKQWRKRRNENMVVEARPCSTLAGNLFFVSWMLIQKLHAKLMIKWQFWTPAFPSSLICAFIHLILTWWLLTVAQRLRKLLCSVCLIQRIWNWSDASVLSTFSITQKAGFDFLFSFHIYLQTSQYLRSAS